MAVYGPVCHPQNIISKTKNEFEQNPEEAIHTIVTDIECNIRIGRLPLGRGTDQWNSGNIISTTI
jgi:hypothetical protein